MKHNWRKIRIGNLVRQSENSVELIPTETYSLLGMSLEGRGLFLREQKQGVEIGAKTLNQVTVGDFIYSRLFAWKGAFDYVRDEFEGTFVSDEYPTFRVNEEKADLKFMHYYFNQAKVWKEVEEYCIGVTKASRNRFKEKYFLNFEIPIPDLPEQKRIVEIIENVNLKKDKIEEYRNEQDKEFSNLRYSIFEKAKSEYGVAPIGKFIYVKLDSVIVDPSVEYVFAGLYGFGNGLFNRGIQRGDSTTYKTFNRLHSGQLVMSQPKGWEGAISIVSEKYDGLFLSPVYISFEAFENYNIKYVAEYCKMSSTWKKMLDVSKGIGARRNSIYASDFLKIEIPAPPLQEQNRIVSLLEKLNEVKANNIQTEKELTELLPALLDKAFKGEL